MSLTVAVQNKLQGFYQLKVIRGDGSVDKTDWFPNLITDQGLDFIGDSGVSGNPNAGPAYTAGGVGTGATTPAFSDTTLTTQLATSTTFGSGVSGAFNSVTYVAGATPYWSGIAQVNFGLGAVIGNIAEVGIGRVVSTVLKVFSHALILDGGGSPTTISLTATDTLQLFYEERMYLQTTDTSYSFDMNSVTYSGVWRSAKITSAKDKFNYVALNTDGIRDIDLYVYNGSIGTITGSPSGAIAIISQSNGITKGTYAAGTYYIGITALGDIGQLNVPGGITAMMVSYGMGSFQFSVSPTIPKDNTYSLQLNINVSWARY